MEQNKDLKKAAGAVLDTVQLDPESYRLGHTKACNKMSKFYSWIGAMLYSDIMANTSRTYKTSFCVFVMW